MNKKGNVLDILWIAVMLFGVIVSFVLLATVGKEVNDDIIAGGDLNATSEVPLVTVTSGLPTWLDNGIMFLFIGLVIGGLSISLTRNNMDKNITPTHILLISETCIFFVVLLTWPVWIGIWIGNGNKNS